MITGEICGSSGAGDVSVGRRTEWLVNSVTDLVLGEHAGLPLGGEGVEEEEEQQQHHAAPRPALVLHLAVGQGGKDELMARLSDSCDPHAPNNTMDGAPTPPTGAPGRRSRRRGRGSRWRS